MIWLDIDDEAVYYFVTNLLNNGIFRREKNMNIEKYILKIIVSMRIVGKNFEEITFYQYGAALAFYENVQAMKLGRPLKDMQRYNEMLQGRLGQSCTNKEKFIQMIVDVLLGSRTSVEKIIITHPEELGIQLDHDNFFTFQSGTLFFGNDIGLMTQVIKVPDEMIQEIFQKYLKQAFPQ